MLKCIDEDENIKIEMNLPFFFLHCCKGRKYKDLDNCSKYILPQGAIALPCTIMRVTTDVMMWTLMWTM